MPKDSCVRDPLIDHVRMVRDEAIILYAGANLVSNKAQGLACHELNVPPAMGLPFKKQQPLTGAISELEQRNEALAARLFRGVWTETRLPSCTMANMILIREFCRTGPLLTAAGSLGAHFSQRIDGVPHFLGIESYEVQTDSDGFKIDADATIELLKTIHPAFVMLGGSIDIGPDPAFAAIAKQAGLLGAVVALDCSHSAAFFATGGAISNPFDQGIDLLVFSTYKSLGGPSGCLIIGRRRDLEDRIKSIVTQFCVSQSDPSRMPVLNETLHEIRRSGEEYCVGMNKNARALLKHLADDGFTSVAPRETDTNQIVVTAPGLDGSAVSLLAESGILVGDFRTPLRPGKTFLRLGTQIVTRLGMGEPEMAQVANLISDVIAKRIEPRTCKATVELLRRSFKHVILPR